MSYYPPEQTRRRRGGGASAFKVRLLIAGAIVLFSVISYLASGTVNPVTGEKQRVNMTEKEEIALGLSARPSMIQQHRGISDDRDGRLLVENMGSKLMNALYHRLKQEGIAIPYPFEFHLLNDDQVVNAFALPGGQVLITVALLYQLENKGQLAGVIGHEIGHVIERHGAQRMAKGKLTQGLIGAAGVAGGGQSSQNAAAMVGNLINKSYGRNDELESDRWGIELMVLIGYDPTHMLGVMDILEKSTGGAGGQPEFMSTHPKPANRKAYIKQILDERFPGGLPPGLR